ncbi:MAG: hypothetical protein PHF51_03670 [Candidatus ainarchaeum sp.]|nr:hypothetical protein [Candidatus ainarchaeum sp.]
MVLLAKLGVKRAHAGETEQEKALRTLLNSGENGYNTIRFNSLPMFSAGVRPFGGGEGLYLFFEDKAKRDAQLVFFKDHFVVATQYREPGTENGFFGRRHHASFSKKGEVLEIGGRMDVACNGKTESASIHVTLKGGRPTGCEIRRFDEDGEKLGGVKNPAKVMMEFIAKEMHVWGALGPEALAIGERVDVRRIAKDLERKLPVLDPVPAPLGELKPQK